ncbi:sperm-tail PG-rich repeat-containing protein 2 [Osmia lignaria lignaria]|uniref:sperm-tail PG-rich repeat-containing protein 2 n=1 Tax=Osmia lignaria lignaria TaxID=1437193 RepID=UPI00402B1641
MAYDKVERFPKLITPTPAEVAPGTYDLTNISCPQRHLAEFSPFLCGTRRQTLSVSKNEELVPGPGSYCIKEPQKHIPERVSIDFTDPRFKENKYVGPGPTEYDVKENSFDCYKIRSHPGTWRGPAGKLWLGRPPRSILPASTSVPHKNHTGYHVDEYGVFVKNPPLKHEPTFLYNVPRKERNMTTLLYKGNFWSRMSGRSAPPPSLTPGPGYYEYETKKTATELQNEKIREAKRMSSRQLRSLDIIYRRTIRENLPAPNCYHVKGSFDRFLKSSCKCDPYALEPPPFGRTAKRFDDKNQSDIPGPGTYDPQDRIKCIGSLYFPPFGAYANRFKKESENNEPAPCDYHSNVGNLAYESQKRFKYSYSRPTHFFFNQMSSFQNNEDYCIPNFVEKNQVEKYAVYHAAFKSRTKRFPKAQKGDIPDPGAYEVLTAFKANRDRCDILCRPVPFGSRISRFPPTPRKDKDHMPGKFKPTILSNTFSNSVFNY